MSEQLIDLLANKDRRINCLDHGFVELVDVLPRLVSEGQSAEFRIVEAARISHEKSTSTVEEDKRLIRYLVRNQHTSPLEHASVTLRIKAPIFVIVHLLRHRTAKINQASRRYTPDSGEYYHPSEAGGVRVQSKNNHQSSLEYQDTDAYDETKSLFKQMETKVDEIYDYYNKLIESGAAKETARSLLPQASYSELIYTLDCNNLMKFLYLRDASDAQKETQVFANAIDKLVRPLFPTLFEMLDERRQSVTFNPVEIKALTETKEGKVKSPYKSGPTRTEFIRKVKVIHPDLIVE